MVFICVQVSTASAQNQSYKQKVSLGVNASTNGMGLNFIKGIKPNKFSTKNSIGVELNTLYHPQETKVQNPRRANAKAYVFGKLNAAGVLRINYNFNYALGQAKIGSPSLQYGFSVGPSLGILKPYYVGFQDPESQNTKPAIVQQSDYTNENQEYIYGPASWTKGFSELNPKLGLNLDAHFSVIWNNSYRQKEWKSGIRADYFPNEFKILYNSDKKVFMSIYTSYFIGRS